MKIINKVKNVLKINKKLFIFLLIIVLFGVLAGTALSIMLSNDDQKMVIEYLGNFFGNLNNINHQDTFINTLIITLGFSLLIYLLGISVIGFIVILFMLFGKAFVLGFSISSIIKIYQLKGIVFTFFYIFPHHIINLLLFIILSGMALTISFKIINNITKENKVDFSIMKKYNYVLLITLLVQILTSIYEAYLVPKLLYFAVNILK